MGLFDKIKDVAKAATDEISKFSNERAEAVRASQRPFDELVQEAREEKMANISYSCENGRCAWTNHAKGDNTFVYSCPMSCACPKKKEHINDKILPISNAEQFGYVYDYIRACGDGGINYIALTRQSSDMTEFYLKESYRDEREAVSVRDDIIEKELNIFFDINYAKLFRKRVADDYVAKCFPAFADSPVTKRAVAYFTIAQYKVDIDANPQMQFIKCLHDRILAIPDFKINDASFGENLFVFLEYCFDYEPEVFAPDYFTLSDDCPYFMAEDPSVFNRDEADFTYTANALYIAAKLCHEALMDEYPNPAVNIVHFMEGEGHIKPVGMGGPTVGETGDTIWNSASDQIVADDDIYDELSPLFQTVVGGYEQLLNEDAASYVEMRATKGVSFL